MSNRARRISDLGRSLVPWVMGSYGARAAADLGAVYSPSVLCFVRRSLVVGRGSAQVRRSIRSSVVRALRADTDVGVYGADIAKQGRLARHVTTLRADSGGRRDQRLRAYNPEYSLRAGS